MTDPDGALGTCPPGLEANATPKYLPGRHFPVFTDIKRQANPSRSLLRILDSLVKKIPHRVGMGLKIPSLRWIREGQTLPAGDAEATVKE